MKRFNKTLLLLVSLVGLTVVSSLLPMVSAVNTSQVNGTGTPARERWWNSQWHYRKLITIDANNYDRRWGRPIETSIGIYNFPDLDMNSIRLIYKNSEIPSSYHRTGAPPTYTGDTLVFVTNESMNATSGLMKFTVYYDSTTNGMKIDPNYGIDWAKGVIDAYQTTDKFISDYGEARDAYQQQFRLYMTGTNTGQINGYDVVFNTGTNRWEYAEDIPNAFPHPIHVGDPAHYITGSGTFFYLDGRQVYSDDQGNWYFSDPHDGLTFKDSHGVVHQGGINGSLYFMDGHYHFLVDNLAGGGNPGLIEMAYNSNYELKDDDGNVVGMGAWIAGFALPGNPIGQLILPAVVIGTE